MANPELIAKLGKCKAITEYICETCGKTIARGDKYYRLYVVGRIGEETNTKSLKYCDGHMPKLFAKIGR